MSHNPDCNKKSKCKKKHHKKKKCKCVSVIEICPEEFLPNTGKIISVPGVYKLKCNVTFAPATNGVPALTIASSDVDLDFDDHILSMSTSSTTSDNVGILVAAGLSNITIYDGTIENFSADSIKTADGVENLDIYDMTLSGLASGSRLLVETVTAGINVAGSVNSPANIIKVRNVLIKDFLNNNMATADLLVRGINAQFANNVEVLNCRAINLRSIGLISATATVRAVGGFRFTSCNNVIVRKSEANDNQALNPNVAGNAVGDVTGFAFDTCKQAEIYNSSSSNNLGTRRSQGFLWANGTVGFVGDHCVAANNLLVDPNAAGSASRFGFEIVSVTVGVQPEKGVLRDCISNNEQNGFAVTGGKDVLLQRCVAIAFDVTSAIVVGTINVAGFMVRQSTAGPANGVTLDDCVATGFQSIVSGTPNPAAGFGFLVTSNAVNVNIRRGKATKCNVGIELEVPTNVVVDSNEVAFNLIAGLRDTTAAQTHNLIIRNVAYSNPSNYIVNTANPNFTVVQASQAAAFPNESTTANISPLSNYDLQP